MSVLHILHEVKYNSNNATVPSMLKKSFDRGSRKARAQGNDGTAASRDPASIVVRAGELT